MSDVRAFTLHPPTGIEVLDQTILPHEERWLDVRDLDVLCEAIRSLRVRGAPLLGIMGAAGMAIAAAQGMTTATQLSMAAKAIKATRPTAVDLGWAVDRALEAVADVAPDRRADALWRNVAALAEARVREDRAIGALGAPLLEGAVLTHCNTGALATGGTGTALGVILAAWEQGRITRVFATETRPLLQGARLTAWELTKLGIPATLLPDTAVASLLGSGEVHAVITGADRIAANGDTANKIGTLQLALAAKRFGVPFYIAAPTSTVDLACPNGAAIPIEHRSASEVGGFGGHRWAPEGVQAFNPAFDVTPADLITAIVTERAVHTPGEW